MKKKNILIVLILLLSFIYIPVYAEDTSSRELQELEVENHSIYFYKERTDYKLLLEDGENSLVIKAIPFDEKAKVEIVGADNLEENNYLVTVTVTDTKGNNMVYNIKAEKKAVIEETKENGLLEKIQAFFDSIHFKPEWLLFILVGVVIIFIPIKIISARKGKKIDSTMDKF